MLKKQKTEQAFKWNTGLPLLGARIDFSILIGSKKNRFSESRFNRSSKKRLKIDITTRQCNHSNGNLKIAKIDCGCFHN